MNKFKLTREKYKDIKRKDHNQMEEFVVSIYSNGFNDGKEAATKSELSLDQIEDVIRSTKGIGPAKGELIMTNIRNLISHN